MTLQKGELKQAKLLFEKDVLEDAVNRAYYSFFMQSKQCSMFWDMTQKTHSGLISEFGLRMIKTGMLDKKFGQFFRKAFETIESSDYEIGITFGKEEVQTLIKNAEEFLKKAQEFVYKNI